MIQSDPSYLKPHELSCSKKSVALVVLYHPDAEALNYLPQLARLVDHLILVDNTPEVALQKEWGARVHYLPNKANLGIAKALNQGIQMAIALGTEEIFLFDQDSRVEPGFFLKMLEFKNACPPKTIICAPDFLDVNTQTLSRFAKLHKWGYSTVRGDGSLEPLDVTFVITSGSLLDISSYLGIGPFREDYFIDHVDSEFCLRAHVLGFKIFVTPRIIINHAIGERTLHRLFGMTIKPNHHNPARRYYIARNGVRITLDYLGKIPSILVLNTARMIHDILGILFFEENRWRKIRALCIGIKDGALNRMGPAPSTVFK